VEELYEQGTCPHGEELLSLARGPTPYVKSYTGYITNGFKFHTVRREIGARTQNSRVLVVGNAGAGEPNIDYYGLLTEVFSLEYTGGNEVVFFRCKWWDIDPKKGVKVDKFGFVSVNCQRHLKTDDPFVLAAQASQVFYVNDISQKGWRVVVKVQPRDSYEPAVGEDKEQSSIEENDEAYQQSISFNVALATSTSTEDFEYANAYYRNDVAVESIDMSSLPRKTRTSRKK